MKYYILFMKRDYNCDYNYYEESYKPFETHYPEAFSIFKFPQEKIYHYEEIGFSIPAKFKRVAEYDEFGNYLLDEDGLPIINIEASGYQMRDDILEDFMKTGVEHKIEITQMEHNKEWGDVIATKLSENYCYICESPKISDLLNLYHEHEIHFYYDEKSYTQPLHMIYIYGKE